MRDNYSFRTRTLLSFWIVLLVALFLPPWYYFHTLNREVLEDSKGRAVQELNLVQWMLQQNQSISTVENLQGWLVELGEKLRVRITYVAEGGKVIADSEVAASEIPNLENHAGRPEIMLTQTREIATIIRYSGTIRKDLIYTAKRVPKIAGIPAGVLRIAAPLSQVKEPLDRLKSTFLFFLSLVFLATAGLSYLLIRRINRPLGEMIETAEAISSKDYDRRIHSSPGNEFYPLTQAINRMAESIQNRIKTVTEQKQELEAVFDAMREGVMVLDARGKIKSVNRTFAELTSDIDRVTGRRPLEVIANPELQKICDRAVAMPADTETGPFNLQIALGAERTYDVNIVWLPDQKGGLGAVAVFHDITEIKRLEKVRQDFVANVSHELRTPLTSIKGYTETLLSETPPDPATAQSFLGVILKNTNHMVKMVEDLLQLARLETPNDPLKMVPVNAAGALLTAWRSCAHHAEGKNLSLENQIPEDNLLVSSDFDQLVQVFRNLLENGIRYSPSDEVLTVACHSQGDHVMFSIRDEGPGISRQHQQRIFERFYRIEKHRSDHWGSTGLGLAICRHIIRNHGGSIWVRSPNPGETKGTTFFFTLRKAPLEPGNQANGEDAPLSNKKSED